MKQQYSPAAGMTRRIECADSAARFQGKKAKGKIANEARALILAHPDASKFRQPHVASAEGGVCATALELILRSPKTSATMSTRIEFSTLAIGGMRVQRRHQTAVENSCTAVQHLTKALFLSKRVEPPLCTLSRADGGVDSTFSLEPAEMAQLVVETERAWQALGQVSYGPTEAEKESIQFRRSLYVVQDLKAGEVLTRENVRAIRPGLGLPTKYLEQVLGKAVKQDVKRGTALGWDVLL